MESISGTASSLLSDADGGRRGGMVVFPEELMPEPRRRLPNRDMPSALPRPHSRPGFFFCCKSVDLFSSDDPCLQWARLSRGRVCPASLAREAGPVYA